MYGRQRRSDQREYAASQGLDLLQAAISCGIKRGSTARMSTSAKSGQTLLPQRPIYAVLAIGFPMVVAL